MSKRLPQLDDAISKTVELTNKLVNSSNERNILKKELIQKLKDIAESGGGEEGHVAADELLLKFINDEQVTEAFNSIPNMWYA